MQQSETNINTGCLGSSVTFAGLARNCEVNLTKNLRKIDALRPYFNQIKIVFLENDSTDATLQVIQSYAEAHSDVVFDSFTEKTLNVRPTEGKSRDRIERMCQYRNRLLGMVQGAGKTDYVIFIDWDIIDFDEQSIVAAIQNAPEGWGGICADSRILIQHNQKQFYFALMRDYYAFLPKELSYESIPRGYFNKYKSEWRAKWYEDLLSTMDYMECSSAFGGIGIYKRAAIEGCTYKTRSLGDDDYVCEHIYFNECVRNNGFKIYIARDLKTVCDVYRKNAKSYFFRKHIPLAYLWVRHFFLHK